MNRETFIVRRRWLFTLLLAVLGLAGCSVEREKPKLIKQGAPVLKVKVLRDGTILADDQPIELAALDARFAALKAAGGGVWVYREDAGLDGHANSLQVVKLIADHLLPVQMSSTPDFSDSAEFSGMPR